ncbi:MAG: MBL fold metallo-hydrolase [Patescibacteria group bacterium]|nr:MBL fold metallo-hydrolase [Patescibacteria group bacterium]MCL5262183.1 MBL fold metallo-hydrolase [Patescibacteria group bacterium]
MTINWYGGGCYKIQTPNFNLIIDPETAPAVGNRLKGDLILHTSDKGIIEDSKAAAENFPPREGEIFGPGEYNIGPAKVRGVLISKESGEKQIRTAFRVELDEIKLGFLGDVSSDLTEEELDDFDEIDILFAPGAANVAMRYVKSVEPKVVIPAGDSKKLAVELGQDAEPQEKLVVKKKDLEAEEKTRLAILSC